MSPTLRHGEEVVGVARAATVLEPVKQEVKEDGEVDGCILSNLPLILGGCSLIRSFFQIDP